MDFRLVSDYKPKGDQGTAIDRLLRGICRPRAASGSAGGYGLGQDLHHGQSHRAVQPARAGDGPQQDAGRAALSRVQELLSRTTRSNISSPITTTTSPKRMFPPPISTSKKNPPSTTSSTSCGFRRLGRCLSGATLIVASVSCIYGLGSPEAYYGMLLFLEKGQKIKREDITRKLVEILYERTDGDFRRGTFRVRGDVIEIFPTYDDMAYRIELWGDEIDSLSQIDPLFGTVKQKYVRLPIYPKTHYVMKPETRARRWIRSRKNWRGGKANWRSRGGWSRRSGCISGPCLTWR